MAVYPSAWRLEMGLGGSYRRTLIDEQYNVLTLPLSDLAVDRARDISGKNNHGTYVGTGFTPGISMGFPEPILGMMSDGNGYIEVPDDGGASAVGDRSLSLEGGDIDLAGLVQTTHNSATRRCLIGKQETNSTGNGFHVALLNGALRAYLKVAGVLIFDFSSGVIADGLVHIWVLNYLTGSSVARFVIDSFVSGSVSGVTTEPQYTSAPLRCYMFTNGTAGDGSGFIGTQAMVFAGREGNANLGANLQPTRFWTNVTDDVRQIAPVVAKQGIPGNGVLDNVARPGALTLAMNNGEWNSARKRGLYSPGHANCRSGFEIGVPIRWTVNYLGVSYVPFYGAVKTVAPRPGVYDARESVLTASDWIDVAARVVMSAVEAQIDARSDDVLRLVLDQAEGRVPPAVEIAIGTSEFPFALDMAESEQESILTEITRVVGSERGYFYQRGDTVVYEGRATRQLLTALSATFNGTMHGLEVDYSFNHFVNIVRCVITPRRVDPTPTTILYSLEISRQNMQIPSGGRIVLEGGYRHPSKSESIGGTEVFEPVANTDYGFNADAEGTGADLSGSLSVFTDNGRWLGGNSFRVEIENRGEVAGYLRLNGTTAFQLRGKGVYYDKPFVVERSDRDSVRRHGPKTVQIDLMYECDVNVAESVADYLLGILSDQRAVPRTLTIKGNVSAEMMRLALSLQIGDKVGVVEAMTGISTDSPDEVDVEVGYYINEKTLTMSAGGLITATFRLAPSGPSGNLWVLGVAGASELGQTTALGF